MKKILFNNNNKKIVDEKLPNILQSFNSRFTMEFYQRFSLRFPNYGKNRKFNASHTLSSLYKISMTGEFAHFVEVCSNA